MERWWEGPGASKGSPDTCEMKTAAPRVTSAPGHLQSQQEPSLHLAPLSRARKPFLKPPAALPLISLTRLGPWTGLGQSLTKAAGLSSLAEADQQHPQWGWEGLAQGRADT